MRRYPASRESLTVGVLDIVKVRGDVSLVRLDELLSARIIAAVSGAS